MHWALLLLVAATAGCGGKVVFVEDGDGDGTGGSGASSGSGTNPADACAGFCAKLESCGLGSPSCASDCLLLSVPGCESQAADMVQCFADSLDPVTCLPDECISESIKYATCAGVTPEPPDPGECSESCEIGDTLCSCTRSCEFSIQEASCKAGSPSEYECECFENGSVVGTCIEPVASACDLDVGCCAEFFSG